MNKEFLYSLLDTMSVTGYEIPIQKKVIAEMTPCVDEIRTDLTGNVYSIINPDAPFRVLLAGHIDEIGLVVTLIQEDGLVRVTRAGGIYPHVFPGHQVVIHGAKGPVYGAVVNYHGLVKESLKAEDFYIDIGARDGDDARQHVQTGDPVILNTGHQEMINNLLTSRAIDDRAGAFILLEALKRAKERGCKVCVTTATTVGEETNKRGAVWANNAVKPHVAIAVDVTYCTDVPGTHPEAGGMVRLGKGPVLCNSTLINKKFNEMLKAIAAERNIPYQVETYLNRTCTDIDELHLYGSNVATALISLPLRYMHSPAEVCSLDDIENCIELIAEFLCRVDENTDFDPFK